MTAELDINQTNCSTTMDDHIARSDSGSQASHIVQFYETEHELCEVVIEYLAAGLRNGDSLIIIATEPHRRSFAERLGSQGFDLKSELSSGRVVMLDAAEALARFMVGDVPNGEAFLSTIGREIENGVARAGASRLRAYGEMVDLLWKSGNPTAALRLEEMWNDLQSVHEFSLYCAYVMGSFYNEPSGLNVVAATHDHVVQPCCGAPRAESDAELFSPQQARALAAEIAQRKALENALRESLHELRSKEQALRVREGELRDFVDNATMPLHWLDAAGKIVWANRAELELLGYARQDFIGRHFADFHVDRSVGDELLSRLHQNQRVHEYPARLRARDGSIKHVVISSNVYFKDGEFVHTRCFTRDVTDRKRVEDALRDNERKLQLVIDALPVLVSYVDREQRYQLVNVAYERWFGVSRNELIGRTLEEALGPEIYGVIHEHVQTALSGRGVAFQARAVYPPGITRSVEGSYVPHLDTHGRTLGFVALVADVSERKRLEEQRETASRRADRLLKITAAIADAVSAREVHEAVVDQVKVALEAATAGLWLVEDDDRSARLVHFSGYPDAARKMLELVPLEGEISFPALDAIRRSEPIWIASQQELLAQYPELSSLALSDPNYRISCLPIVVDGRTLGSLALTFDEARGLDDDERNFLLLVARYSGQALERLRLLGAEQRSRAATEAGAARMLLLSRASRTFAEAATDLSKLLQSVVEQVTEEYADGAGITLVNGDRLELGAADHRNREILERARSILGAAPMRIGHGVTGRVVATGDRVVVEKLDVDALAAIVLPVHRAALDLVRPGSLVIVPLRSHGTILGTLSAIRDQGRPGFTQDDASLLEELAERAATAIENARLYQENEQARLRAEQLYSFARVVVGAESLDQIFEDALDAIEQALGVRKVSILIYDAQGVIRFRAWRGLSDAYRQAVEGHSPWPRDARDPKPVLVSDVSCDPALERYLPLFIQEQIGALSFIPLVASGRLIGKLMLYHDRPYALSLQELQMATAFANLLGSVAARFSLVDELKQSVRFYEMFTGILGHDLRNPLSAIMTAAQIAINRGEGERMSKPLSRIVTSGERMARMIDQLLDFTRVRVGQGIPLEPKPFDLVSMLKQVIDEIDVAYPRSTLRLEHLGDTAGAWDMDRLSQVFSNLLANAVQHGDVDQGVAVRVDGSAPEHLYIEVRNAGTIPEALLPTLFEPLRGSERRHDKSHGLGLGLFISREIVRAHSGTIDVRSTDDVTTFRVLLPRSACPRTLVAAP